MCVEENSWIPVEQVSLQGEFRDERYIDALKGGVKGGSKLAKLAKPQKRFDRFS